MLAGGSFGRRAAADFIVEVAEICQGLDGEPVKLIWTREDEFRHDYLRPCAVSRVTVSVVDKTIDSWDHALVSESPDFAMADEYVATFPIVGSVVNLLRPHWRPPTGHSLDFLNPALEEGLTDTIYDMRPAVRTLAPPAPRTVPVGYWRSVGRFHTVFAVESMIDELATAAQLDPVTFRLRHLGGAARARMRDCIDEVVDRAGREEVVRAGAGYGLACFSGWHSFAALVVQVTVEDRAPRAITVRRAWAAVDCGFVLSPDVLCQQVEGGIIFGLSAALKQEITTVNGVVAQTNFHACDLVRMHECPDIDVTYRRHPSTQAPTGVGELMVPLAAPAVANAVCNLTGARLRRLPLTLGGPGHE
jgi:CO/xanthine dehydrogenase Mo-binding subunit